MKRFHEKSEGASAVRRASVMQKSLRGAVCASLLLLSGSMAQAQTEGSIIFEALCETENVPHRIPAIVETSNNEILVFGDRRWGFGDIGQHNLQGLTGITCNGTGSSKIDILFRRGKDFGAEFAEKTPVTDIAFEYAWNSGAPGNNDVGSGDAAVVANRENPAEILMMAGTGDVFFTMSQSNGDRLEVRRLYSQDGGRTWSDQWTNAEGQVCGSTEMTKQMYDLVGYDGLFFTSGRILQSSYKADGAKYYRLYAGLCTIDGNYDGTHNSVVVYSDDFGKTWTILGTKNAITGGDEAKVEELPNGNILVSAKYENGTRKFNIYDIEAEAWMNTNGGLEYRFNDAKATNGEFIIVPVGNGEFYALQSIPTTSGVRENVKIYYKKLSSAADYDEVEDFTRDGSWCSTEEAYMLASGTASYSSMILQSNGKIGVAYEQGEVGCTYEAGKTHIEVVIGWPPYKEVPCTHASGYNIVYKSLDISEIVSATETEEVSAAIAKKMNKCSGENHAADLASASDMSWASFYWPVAVQLPADNSTTAYVVSSVSEDQTSVILSELGSQIVPANEPVILRSAGAPELIYLTPVASAETFSGTNLLVGSTGNNQEITDLNYKNFYVLSHGSKCEGFYYTINGYIPANLAYLELNNGAAASVLKLQIGDDVTGIGSVMTGATEGTNRMFDLSGRRVQDTAAPGIYIVNGKKVLVK